MSGRGAAVLATVACALAVACGSSSPSAPSPVGTWTPGEIVGRVPLRPHASSTYGPLVAAGGDTVYVTWPPRGEDPLVTARLRPDGVWSEPDAVTEPFVSAYALSLDADLAGNAMTTWIAPRSGGANLWCLWAAATGPRRGWSEQVMLACAVGSSRLAVGPSGDATAVWADETTHALVAARYQPGRGWGRGERLTGGDRQRPLFDVAVDATGRSIVVWDERPFGNTVAGVSVATADRDGPWSARRMAEPMLLQGGPQVAFERDGFGVATWQGGTGRGVQAVRLSAEPANPVDISGNGGDQCPEVAGSGVGKSVIAWSRREGRHAVFAAYGADGRWEPVAMTPDRPLPPWCPDVAMDAAGNAVVAWEEGFGPMRPEVWASTRTAAGPWSEPIRLAVGAKFPSVAIAGGVAHVVWAPDTFDAVYASRVRLTP